jgi:hypothetical protein
VDPLNEKQQLLSFAVCVEGGQLGPEYHDGAEAMAEAIRIRREGLPEYGVPDVVTVLVSIEEV